MMSNFGNSNLLGNQRRRNFIYNPVATRSRDSSSFTPRPGSLTSSVQPGANINHESPCKKFKSSHCLPDKKAEEIAAEEACRDLPLDAFDEEFDALEDDVDEELLTAAEQFDERDRAAAMKLETQRTYPAEVTSNATLRNENYSSASKDAFYSSRLSPADFSDENDDTINTQEYVVNTAYSSLSETVGFPVSDTREFRAPIVTHPEEHARVKSDLVLHSFVDHCNGSVSIPSGHTTNSSSHNTTATSHLGDGQMENLRKEIERLKADFVTASLKVKTLEEEKFCKDGEIKILRDSLEHYQADEKRRQGEERAVQEQQAREQSQHEKELEKQVENLTTQIRFKEREISQMIEHNKKRTASLTEGSNSSPKRKTVNLSEVFPTGSSFFQKTSPETKVRSPRSINQSPRDLKTQSKRNSQRLSEGDNSENSALSDNFSGSSTREKMKAQQRETNIGEKEIVQFHVETSLEVELVQNLLAPCEKELHLFHDLENRTSNEGSIISLLSLDRPLPNFHSALQKTTLTETNVSHTMRLFETQGTSNLQRSMDTVTQKDCSISGDNTLVMQTLSELLNQCQEDSDSKCITSTTKLKDHHHLPKAINFLPLLECHILRYIEQRTETTDDNILSTCLPRGSPTQDFAEPKDGFGFESEHAKNLATLQTTALTTLRLLNILVLYSNEVCGCILKSSRAHSYSSDDDNDRVMERKGETSKIFSSKEVEGFSQHPLFASCNIATKKSAGLSSHSSDSSKQVTEVTTLKEEGSSEPIVQQTELLGYLFKLLAPDQRESMSVVFTTLQVLTSLAKNCEAKYYPRMLPLLSDSLLSQCLSRDWSLNTLSLVTSLLTPLTRHSDILKRLCSLTQSDHDCLLLKIYQGWSFTPDDVPTIHYQQVHLQIVGFVNNLLKNNDSSTLLFPPESECHCSLELIKCLVLMLNRVVNSLGNTSAESLIKHAKDSYSLVLLRQGVFLLSTLCLNDRLFVDHRVEVEHQYIHVVSSVTRLYKQIAAVISEAEVLAVQELVDFEHIDGIEWSQESEDEEDENVEGMDVAE